MTFNVSQSFYSNICELSPWWLEASACLAADKVTYDYIWLNKLVPVPAGTSGRNFFPVPVGSGSGRNSKNWFRCTPTIVFYMHLWVWKSIVISHSNSNKGLISKGILFFETPYIQRKAYTIMADTCVGGRGTPAERGTLCSRPPAQEVPP